MASSTKALRFGSHIKEFRVHLCQKSPSSQGTREFVEKYYTTLKLNNPKFPFLIRECQGVEPKLYARYSFGRESSITLSGLNSGQVMEKIELLSAKPT